MTDSLLIERCVNVQEAVNYHMGYTLQVRYILRTIVNLLIGTYWYNARNILVVYSCVGMDLTVISFRPRGSFSANSCLTFVAFLEPQIQSVIISNPRPPT